MKSSAIPPRPVRVLVVEDDPEAALFAGYVLERGGHFVVTCTADPGTALALAGTGSWDLAVADLDLPLLSGIELVAKLRCIDPCLPVILDTAHPRDAVADAAGRQPDGTLAGVRPEDVLVKPFTAGRLLAAAAAVCDTRGWPAPA